MVRPGPFTFQRIGARRSDDLCVPDSGIGKSAILMELDVPTAMVFGMRQI